MSEARESTNCSRSPVPEPPAGEVPRRRHSAVMDTVWRAGLLSGQNARSAERVHEALIQAANEQSGLTADTELLQYALAKVALEDNCGPKILVPKGSVPTLALIGISGYQLLDIFISSERSGCPSI